MDVQSRLLSETIQLKANNQVLILNSAQNPFVPTMARAVQTGEILLAEDNIAALATALQQISSVKVRHMAFHDYCVRQPAETSDIAMLDLLYQPANAWMVYALRVALYALRPGGRLYVIGPKERGILTIGKRMQELFGNVSTLTISKGLRVLCAEKHSSDALGSSYSTDSHDPSRLSPTLPMLRIFADNKLDEGTRLLLEALEVQPTDRALDIGCGAGFIGLHIARQARQGQVTMLDASLAAVDVAQQAVERSGLSNVRVLASDGAQAVLAERFDLVVTNPPFHQGGIQTTAIAEHFIREAAQVLHPGGRFFLVANRFLKYEPMLRVSFTEAIEVGGDTRYKVLRAIGPRSNGMVRTGHRDTSL